MWKRIFNEYKLLVFPEIFAGLFRRTNVLLSKFPAMAKHVVVDNDQDVHHLMRKGKVHLVFTEEEEERGRKALKSFGIPENTPFLCILAREDAYDKTAHPEFYQSNSSTHNCDIVNFMDAAAEMARRGYYVFRMGSVVQKPIPKLDNPMIIDYPFTGKRSEFMDIYLWARCRFAISADSGPVSIPVFSKVPVVIVNKLPLATMFWWDHNILYIPKKLFIKRINRHTTFPEQIFFEASWFENGARTPFQYHVSGLEMEECTPGEIFDVAVEMDDRLKGVHIANPEDEKLQAQFWNLFPPSLDPVRFVDIRIGSKYLRDNRERLGSGFNK
jgi:putative glycosyltransferase (TIGR04372 family)